MEAKHLNCWQAYWSLYLSCFDFELHHQPRRSMGKSDALLRCANHRDGAQDNQDIVLLPPKLFAVHAMEVVEFTGEEHEILREIWKWVQEGWIEDDVAKMVGGLGQTGSRVFWGAKWHKEDDVLYFQDHIYVLNNPKIHCQIIKQYHDLWVAGHPGW